jgi:hypothetical protein
MKGAGALDCVIYCVYSLPQYRRIGLCSIVYILYLSRNEGEGALDCVLYVAYSLPEPL